MESAQRLLGRTTPLVCGCVLAGAAVLVTVHDPSADGSLFPACAFHQMTGLWCPGCGLTRATHHLLRGDLLGALGSNVFTPFVLLAIVGAWWAWVRWSFDRPITGLTAWFLSCISGAPRWLAVSLLAVVVGYGALRNIPASPFDALAP